MAGTLNLPLPGRVSIWGWLLNVSMDGVSTGNVQAQLSTSSTQQASGPFPSVFAILWATNNATGNNPANLSESMIWPRPLVVTDRVYLHYYGNTAGVAYVNGIVFFE